MLRVDVREVVEHRGLDGLEQAPDLHTRLLVALLGPRRGEVVAGPEVEAGEVGVAWEQLVPCIAVEVPVGGEQGGDRVGLGERAALLPVEGHELRDGQRALLAKQRLGLGEDVAGLARVLRRHGRRLAQRLDQFAGLVEGRQDLLRGGALADLGERA